MAKRILSLIFALVLCVLGCVTVTADTAPAGEEITVLFTHDLHSHLLPAANETGEGEYGGYARLMTAIREQRAIDPDAILVDGGDFSMGSLFQTAYTTSAIELRMMGAMGYDATTFGNHEYDYLPEGLASMLRAAVASGDALPALVCSNYLPPKAGEEGYDGDITAAYAEYACMTDLASVELICEKVHSVFVRKLYIVHTENNFCFGCGKHFIYCGVCHVSLACFCKRAIEHYLVFCSLRIFF